MIEDLAAAAFGFFVGWVLCAMLMLRETQRRHIRMGSGRTVDLTGQLGTYRMMETRQRAEARVHARPDESQKNPTTD